MRGPRHIQQIASCAHIPEIKGAQDAQRGCVDVALRCEGSGCGGREEGGGGEGGRRGEDNAEVEGEGEGEEGKEEW